MPQLLVVLGMHKSGTSLVTEMLQHSAFEMVEPGISGDYDEGNHHERLSTNRLNKELLDCGEASSLRVFAELNPDSVPAPLAARAEALLGELDGRGIDWGFKDPRTCLTYPFWRRILPERHKLLCVFRDVSEVHAHYTKRLKLDPTRGVRTLRAWHEYNLGMLHGYQSADPGRRVLVDYATLMRDGAELDRLARFVERPLADRRVARLKRNETRLGTRLRFDAALYRLIYGNDVFALNSSLKEIAAKGQQIAP